MRLDHTARLDQLLAKHHDVQQVIGSAGETLVRSNQLLVTARDADQVGDNASRWIDRRDDTVAPGVSLFRLRPEAKIDVLELTASLSAGSSHKVVGAGPNHIMTAGPNWSGGPFDEPTPAGDAPTAPTRVADGDMPITTHQQHRPIVGILDTGISEHAWFTPHPWFADCGSDVREVPDADLDYALDSIAGHGTFIAGVILMQAPDAVLWPERAIAGDGVTDELRLLHGLAKLKAREAATGQTIDVLNLSLGCYTHDDKPSPVLEATLRALPRATVVVACAGNSSSERPFWPAALKRVIGVGSMDTAGTARSTFSNYGWWVDACAFGEDITSSFFQFDSEDGGGNRDFTGYATWSGTSFAAPRVAGAIAALAGRYGSSAPDAAGELLDPTIRPSVPDLGVLIDQPVGIASS
jgi:subtilisin family serine protease